MTFFIKRFFTGSLFFVLLLTVRTAPAQQYSFVTHWELRAPVDAVWEAICHPGTWPEWWKGVAVSRVGESDTAGIGTVMRFSWRGRLPYRLRFMMRLTERVDHTKLAGQAWGDLEGTGVWYFREEEGITFVDCYWDVSVRKPWIRRLSWLLRPVFRSNHDLVMRRGAKGLARRLYAPLLAY